MLHLLIPSVRRRCVYSSTSLGTELIVSRPTPWDFDLPRISMPEMSLGLWVFSLMGAALGGMAGDALSLLFGPAGYVSLAAVIVVLAVLIAAQARMRMLRPFWFLTSLSAAAVAGVEATGMMDGLSAGARTAGHVTLSAGLMLALFLCFAIYWAVRAQARAPVPAPKAEDASCYW